MLLSDVSLRSLWSTLPWNYHTVLYHWTFLSTATVYNSKKLSLWACVAQYKKSVLTNVKFHHIMNFHKVSGTFPQS